MSAYICNLEHFGVLAAYAVAHRAVFHKFQREGRVQTAQAVARALAAENIRSVAHRYPSAVSGHRPGPALHDEEILEGAAIYAGHFVKHAVAPSPVEVLKLVSGYDYQACETPDYRDSDAWVQLQWIQNCALRALPGYAAADWSYADPVPAIDALFEGV